MCWIAGLKTMCVYLSSPHMVLPSCGSTCVLQAACLAGPSYWLWKHMCAAGCLSGRSLLLAVEAHVCRKLPVWQVPLIGCGSTCVLQAACLALPSYWLRMHEPAVGCLCGNSFLLAISTCVGCWLFTWRFLLLAVSKCVRYRLFGGGSLACLLLAQGGHRLLVDSTLALNGGTGEGGAGGPLFWANRLQQHCSYTFHMFSTCVTQD
jgi:hypothetical protein